MRLRKEQSIDAAAIVATGGVADLKLVISNLGVVEAFLKGPLEQTSSSCKFLHTPDSVDPSSKAEKTKTKSNNLKYYFKAKT